MDRRGGRLVRQGSRGGREKSNRGNLRRRNCGFGITLKVTSGRRNRLGRFNRGGFQSHEREEESGAGKGRGRRYYEEDTYGRGGESRGAPHSLGREIRGREASSVAGREGSQEGGGGGSNTVFGDLASA